MLEPTFSAFLGDRRLATGSLTEVLGALDARPDGRRAQVFADADGDLVKRGRRAEVERAMAPPVAPSAHPVTLLPRHVAWLDARPEGASAALRRLIETAKRDGVGRERLARDAAYRFVSMMAGDLAGFEEACRALYAGDAARFEAAAIDWPRDVRSYARRLAGEALG